LTRNNKTTTTTIAIGYSLGTGW